LSAFGSIIPHPPAGRNKDEDQQEGKQPKETGPVFFIYSGKSCHRYKSDRSINKPSPVIAEKDRKKMWVGKIEMFITVSINDPMIGLKAPKDKRD
jgi:hypothetical protein